MYVTLVSHALVAHRCIRLLLLLSFLRQFVLFGNQWFILVRNAIKLVVEIFRQLLQLSYTVDVATKEMASVVLWNRHKCCFGDLLD